MPYTHRKVGDETCVYKKEDGSKVGCTKGSIKKYLGALHANVHEEIDKVKGGLADNKSVKDIADKHDTTVPAIKKELKKGEKVEKEHTSDDAVAYEIAKDHTWEDDTYYEDPMFAKELETNESIIVGESLEGYSWDALTDMIVNLSRYEGNEEAIQRVKQEMNRRRALAENSNKSIIKKILREEINLSVTDESPDTTTILVEYNGRNAGIIMTAPANAENTLEIVGIKFKKDYRTRFIIGEAIKSLWGMFKETEAIIVAPKPEGIEFWNKMGFNRISPNYLIKNRGH